MYVFYSKNPNFFNSARPPASFFKTKLTRTKQLIAALWGDNPLLNFVKNSYLFDKFAIELVAL